MEEINIKVDGKEYRAKIEETSEGKLKIHCEGDVYEVETKEKIMEQLENELEKKEGTKEGKSAVVAPLPGIVFSVNVKVGDKVTIIGSDGKLNQSASDLAKRSDLRIYEVLTSIGPRVKRIYLNKKLLSL